MALIAGTGNFGVSEGKNAEYQVHTSTIKTWRILQEVFGDRCMIEWPGLKMVDVAMDTEDDPIMLLISSQQQKQTTKAGGKVIEYSTQIERCTYVESMTSSYPTTTTVLASTESLYPRRSQGSAKAAMQNAEAAHDCASFSIFPIF